MIHKLLAAAATALIGLAGLNTSLAQQGTFGSSNVGASSAVARPSNTFGGSGIGGAAGATRQGQAAIGALDSNVGFQGATNQAGQFVGRGAAEALALFGGQLSGNAGGRGQQLFRAGGQAGRGGGNRGAAANNRSTVIPHRLRVAFQRARAAPGLPAGTPSVALSLERVFKDRLPVRVTVQGRTAILRGVVPTESDRGLAQRVALLEPGISQVQNELTVPLRLSPPETGTPEELSIPSTQPEATLP